MSTLARWNLALAVAIAICVLLILSGGRDLSKPNAEYMPDMAYSPAQESFAPSAVFEDGVTLQSPPPGTIARGRLPLRFTASAEDAERAGRELVNPVDRDADGERQKSARAFAAFCQPCHGATGNGDGAVAQRGYPPPPSLHAERALVMPDGQIFHVLSYGQGNMPGHAAQISIADRWRIVNHVRALQERQQQKGNVQ